MEKVIPHHVKTISAFHALLNLPKPDHPLISVVEIKPFETVPQNVPGQVVYGFYSISLKKNFGGSVKIKYGQQVYDFDEGVLSFMAPGQVSSFNPAAHGTPDQSGWMLLIDSHFLYHTPLAQQLRQYEFFGYAVNEALFLSDKEEVTLTQIVRNIQQEYHNTMDRYSHQIIVAQIESVLSYSERFYQRQFLTRRVTNHELLTQFDQLLTGYFEGSHADRQGLPSVSFLAEQLRVSPDYLSGLLKSLTGLTTQQHIHEKLMEKAKELLSVTNLSISEIAFRLGFEHSQSFNKLFKSKTNQSPLAFRQSFN